MRRRLVDHYRMRGLYHGILNGIASDQLVVLIAAALSAILPDLIGILIVGGRVESGEIDKFRFFSCVIRDLMCCVIALG